MSDLLGGHTRVTSGAGAGARTLLELNAEFLRLRARHGDNIWQSLEGKSLALGLAGRSLPSSASPELAFASPQSIALHWEIENLVEHRQRNILLVGEGGTGKEQLANLVLKLLQARAETSVRSKIPRLGSINCATLTESIAEALLFGVQGGMGLPTVPKEGTPGLVEEADGGVLFLDEFFDAPPNVFPKLLRLLEAREWRRVGGPVKSLRDGTFIVAASNRHPTLRLLADAVAGGQVRSDLLDRFDAKLEVPPLRERREEIPAIAKRLLAGMSARWGDGAEQQGPIALGDALSRALETLQFDWPGNVRDLRRFLAEQVRFRRSEILEKGMLEMSHEELTGWFRTPMARPSSRSTANGPGTPLPAWGSAASPWLRQLRERQLVAYLRHRLSLEPSSTCDIRWVMGVATELEVIHFHRDHRGPGDHPVAPGRFFARAVSA